MTLMQWDKARQEIAKAQTVDEVKTIRDRAQALAAYARQAGESLEVQNQIAEIKLRAERRAGELLADMEKNKGGRPEEETGDTMSPVSGAPKLADLGIHKKQSSRWQQIAELPEETFETHIKDTRSQREELTTASVLRLAKQEKSGLTIHYSSASDEWYTPDSIIQRVVATLGKVDLDPCANSKTQPSIPATHLMTKEDDGLSRAWFGRVYMNPPYGSELAAWVAYLCDQYEKGQVQQAVALVPARTDTKWFRQFAPYPRCFIFGRLRFSGHENSAPFPSMAVYLGPQVNNFVGAFKDIGDVYRRVDYAPQLQ